MARSDKDKRGGHVPRRRRSTYGCGCCPVLKPKIERDTRATRDRAAWDYEERAEEGTKPKRLR